MRGQAPGGGVVPAGEVAAVDPLDLDDPGAEVGELPGGEGGRDGLLDGDDGDAVEGQGLMVHNSRAYRVRRHLLSHRGARHPPHTRAN